MLGNSLTNLKPVFGVNKMGRNTTNRIFSSEVEMEIAVAKWDAKFAKLIGKKKFDSYKFKSNPIAKVLRTSKFRQKIVMDKTKYNRKRLKDGEKIY